MKYHATLGFESKTTLKHTTLVLDQNPRELPSRSMMTSSNHSTSFDPS